MINAREIAIGGVWSASAVIVAGLTWTSYTDAFSQFPGIGGGGSSGTPGPGKPIPKHGVQIGAKGPGKINVGPIGITPATGGDAFDPSQMPAGQGIKAPPPVVVNPLLAAIKSGNRGRVDTEVRRLIAWGNQAHTKAQGWSGKIDGHVISGGVATWLSGQPEWSALVNRYGYFVIQEG